MQILVVDSDRRCLSIIHQALRLLRGAQIVQLPHLEGARRSLEKHPFDLVITDLELRDGSGLELFEHCVKAQLPVIVTSGHFDRQTSMKILAYQQARIIEKPLETEPLKEVVERLLGLERGQPEVQDRAQLLAAMRRAAQRTPAPPPPSPAWEDSAIIGEAPAWRAVVELIAQVADTRAEVLLLGESGTGKELVAKAVHAMSPRASEPFIAVNCAAIPANLLESDLFGHKKGAFTGAIRDRAGRFKEAHRGTIFLDEIGELPLGMQAKLLRVLQEKRFTPVGSDHDESADFRVVAATNIDLQQMVADGAFREDLFHRLYVFPVRLPPLRDRRADIAALAAHFLDRANAQYGRSVPGIAAPVMVALRAQQWPGNVRQLENIINRLVIIARDVEIAPSHLPIDMGLDLTPPPGSDTVEAAVAITAVSATVSATVSDDLPASGIALRPHLIALENRLIDQALARTDGNRNQAARLLGLNRTTLVEKLRKRGI